jgi:hypothetical protein
VESSANVGGFLDFPPQQIANHFTALDELICNRVQPSELVSKGISQKVFFDLVIELRAFFCLFFFLLIFIMCLVVVVVILWWWVGVVLRCVVLCCVCCTLVGVPFLFFSFCSLVGRFQSAEFGGE